MAEPLRRKERLGGKDHRHVTSRGTVYRGLLLRCQKVKQRRQKQATHLLCDIRISKIREMPQDRLYLRPQRCTK